MDHLQTERKSIADFPAVKQYIDDRFPGVDISDIPIYLATASAMNKAGWENAGGCYIHHLRAIFIKKSSGYQRKSVGKFAQLMKRYSARIDTEDVVVHEVLHAISGAANRYSRKFVHSEEEFVYTNCIDFYRAKGMSDVDIIMNNFLPFCMSDVMNSKSEIKEVIDSSDWLEYERFAAADANTRRNMLDIYAGDLVPVIVEKAKDKAQKMINLYEEYGRKMTFFSDGESDESLSRFSGMDFD